MKNIVSSRMAQRAMAAVLLLAAVAALIIGSYRTARAGQYDILFPIRTGTAASISLPYLGPSGSWAQVTGTYPGGYVQTTGSGVVAYPLLVLTGTAAINALPGPIPVGAVGLSSSGTVVIYGTNGAWRSVTQPD